MAYDRYDTRNAPRGERSRWSDDRYENRNRDRERGGRDDDRGFFERAGDQIASWFGDDDNDDRRRSDEHRGSQRPSGWGSPDRSERDRDRERMSGGSHRDRDWSRDEGRERGMFGGGRGRDEGDWTQTRGETDRGGWSARDYNPSSHREFSGADRERDRDRDWERERSQRSDRDRGYRPMAGDYGRGGHESEQFFAASGVGRGERGFGGYERQDRDRSQSEWGRDPYRSTSRAGTADRSDRSRQEDPHYDSWRQRHMSELDRDYDDYRRENSSRFEDDFASWRNKRQEKRAMLVQIREHMEVIGSDKKPVGKVDKVAGDRIILTKSDPESGGAHHSLSCSDIDRVEGERVILDCSSDEARNRWRDESRGRALNERDDQGEMGPHMLNRSFEGTYRR